MPPEQHTRTLSLSQPESTETVIQREALKTLLQLTPEDFTDRNPRVSAMLGNANELKKEIFDEKRDYPLKLKGTEFIILPPVKDKYGVLHIHCLKASEFDDLRVVHKRLELLAQPIKPGDWRYLDFNSLTTTQVSLIEAQIPGITNKQRREAIVGADRVLLPPDANGNVRIMNREQWESAIGNIMAGIKQDIEEFNKTTQANLNGNSWFNVRSYYNGMKGILWTKNISEKRELDIKMDHHIKQVSQKRERLSSYGVNIACVKTLGQTLSSMLSAQAQVYEDQKYNAVVVPAVVVSSALIFPKTALAMAAVGAGFGLARYGANKIDGIKPQGDLFEETYCSTYSAVMWTAAARTPVVREALGVYGAGTSAVVAVQNTSRGHLATGLVDITQAGLLTWGVANSVRGYLPATPGNTAQGNSSSYSQYSPGNPGPTGAQNGPFVPNGPAIPNSPTSMFSGSSLASATKNNGSAVPNAMPVPSSAHASGARQQPPANAAKGITRPEGPSYNNLPGKLPYLPTTPASWSKSSTSPQPTPVIGPKSPIASNLLAPSLSTGQRQLSPTGSANNLAASTLRAPITRTGNKPTSSLNQPLSIIVTTSKSSTSTRPISETAPISPKSAPNRPPKGPETPTAFPPGLFPQIPLVPDPTGPAPLPQSPPEILPPYTPDPTLPEKKPALGEKAKPEPNRPLELVDPEKFRFVDLLVPKKNDGKLLPIKPLPLFEKQSTHDFSDRPLELPLIKPDDTTSQNGDTANGDTQQSPLFAPRFVNPGKKNLNDLDLNPLRLVENERPEQANQKKAADKPPVEIPDVRGSASSSNNSENSESKTISPKVQVAKDLARKYVEDTANDTDPNFETKPDYDRFASADHLQKELAKTAKHDPTNPTRESNESYRRLAAAFLEELIKRLNQRFSELGQDDTTSKVLAGRIADELLSFSPNLSSSLSTNELLKLTALASEVPLTFDSFGGSLLGEIELRLSSVSDTGSTSKKIAGEFTPLNAQECISRIQLLESIKLCNSSCGNICNKILEEVHNTHPLSLVRQRAKVGLRESDHNMQGRIVDEAERSLATRLSLPKGTRGRVQQISSDHLVLLDNGGTPVGIAPLDSKELAPEEPIDKRIEMLHSAVLKKRQTLSRKQLKEFNQFNATQPLSNARQLAYLRFLEDLCPELKRDYQPRFVPLSELSQKSDIFPFSQESGRAIQNLLRSNYAPLRQALEADLGVSLRNIPLRSQIHFFRYLATMDPAGYKDLKDAITKHPTLSDKILTAFVANAERQKFANLLVKVSEAHSTAVVDKLLTKYLEVVHSTESLVETAEKFGSPKELDEVRQTARLQIEASNLFLQGITTRVNKAKSEKDAETIVHKLDEIKHQFLVAAVAIRMGKQDKGEVPLTEIRGVDVKRLSTKEMTAEQKAKIEQLYERNWKSDPDYSDKHREKVLEGHRQAMEGSDTRVYFVEFEGEILACIRVDKLNDGRLHMGALNQRPEFDKAGLGTMLFKHVLDLEAKNKEVVIELTSKKPNLIGQYESLGFKRARTIENWEGLGVDLVELVRKPAKE